jgi:CheY-like chemotaxis protein
MPTNIILIDDDPLQSQTFEAKLRKRYSGARVTRLVAESQFNAFVESLKAEHSEPPDLIVADVMLPWAVASASAPPPPKSVEEAGYSRAGLRCLRTFRDTIDQPVPWVLFTIVDVEAIAQEIGDVRFREKVAILNKEQPLSELLLEIDRLCVDGPKN